MKKIITTLIISLLPFIVLGQIQKSLDTVQIIATKANSQNSTSFIDIGKKRLNIINNGQDFSEIVSLHTPSVTTYSDAGNNYGYTYFRIRGLDQTRINMNWNGVPLNDAEDQGYYASNFVNFTSYISNINVERGVGTTKNGTASVGGTISFESYLSNDSTFNGSYTNTLGSFNTFISNIDINSGVINKKFRFKFDASYLASDGYRNNSGTKGQSLYFSGDYKINKSNILKINLITGNVFDKMAFLAISEQDLFSNRKMNYLQPDETDNFKQTLIQIQYFNKLNSLIDLNTSIFYNRLNGHYYQHLDNYDNFKLYSQSIGFYNNFIFNYDNINIILGTNGSLYYRTHSMNTDQSLNDLYNNTGYRNELTNFIKLNYKLNEFNIFGDIQYRYTQFVYTDINYNQIQNWNFINPKTGFSYNLNKGNQLIFTISYITREPTRSDLLGGADLISKDNYNEVFDKNGNYKVKPESLTDYEIGYNHENKNFQFGINAYYMNFNNEIIAIGQLSYIGLPLRKNVPQSYRTGIESNMNYTINKFNIYYTLGINKSRIKQFTDESTNITYNNTSHLLNPIINYNMGMNYNFYKFLLDVNYRYISTSYLDNTSNKNFILPSYNVINTYLIYNLNKYIETKFFVNNIFNKAYYYSGYDDGTDKYFYVAPYRNYNCSIIYKF